MGEERKDALPLGHPRRHLLLYPNPDVLREQVLAAGLLAPLPLPLQHQASPTRGDGEPETAAPQAVQGVPI